MKRTSSTRSSRLGDTARLLGDSISEHPSAPGVQRRGRTRSHSVSFRGLDDDDVSELGMTLIGEEGQRGLFGQALGALDSLIDHCYEEWRADDEIWAAEQEMGRLEWEAFFTEKYAPMVGRGPQREDRERDSLKREVAGKRQTSIDAKREAEAQRRAAEAKLRRLIMEFIRHGRVKASSSSARFTRSVDIAHDMEGEVEFSKLGVALGPGLTVTRLERGSAGKASGLSLGSRIIAVNGRRVTNESDIQKILKRDGGKVVLTVSEFTRVEHDGAAHNPDSSDGHSRRSLDGDSAERLVPGLYLTPPALYSQGAGWYRLVEGQQVNGFPVWERSTGTGSFWYIYSTPEGEWAVASSQFAMSNNQAELMTAFVHGGVMPIYFDGEWLENDGGEWTTAKGLRVAELEAPAVSDDTSMTLVIQPHKEKEYLCGLNLSDKLVVESVDPGTAAETAGVQPGVKLVAVDGHPVASIEEAAEAMAGHRDVFCVTIQASSSADGSVSQSLCPIKGGGDSYASLKSLLDLRLFGEHLMTEWNHKGGSVLDELAVNLVFPPGADPYKALSEAAAKLALKKASAFPDKNYAELLVMRLYTMAGPDIDSLVGFENVPVFKAENRKDWDEYVETYKDKRNQAVFNSINWASRTAIDPHNPSRDEAWATLKKWMKFLGLMLSLASETRDAYGKKVFREIDREKSGYVTKEQIRKYMEGHPIFRDKLGVLSKEWDEGHGNVTSEEFMFLLRKTEPNTQADLVARGITGLGKEVFEAHRSMGSKGVELHWPAPASCAFDRAVSEAYIRGEASNSYKKKGRSILFLITGTRWGLSLQSISQYPKEAELLLPPLTTFEVQSARDGADIGLEGTLVMELLCKSVLGATSLMSFCGLARVDSLEASEEMKRIFERELQANRAPAGTPVEIKVGTKPNGAPLWKRGVVVKPTSAGYLVEWQDGTSSGGVSTQDMDKDFVRVLPMSTLLKEQLDRDRFDSRYLKKEMKTTPLCFEGLTFRGRIIEAVEPGSPAQRMGFIEGSTVFELQGIPVRDEEDIRKILEERKDMETTALIYVPRVAARAAVLEKVAEASGSIEKEINPTQDIVPSSVDQETPGVEFAGNYVIRVYPGSQAEAAGLVVGCKITSIDGEAVTHDITEGEISQKLRNASKSRVMYPTVRSDHRDDAKTLDGLRGCFSERTAILTKGDPHETLGVCLQGVAITGCETSTAAEKAGIPSGSILKSIDGVPVKTQQRASSFFERVPAGKACIVSYLAPPDAEADLDSTFVALQLSMKQMATPTSDLPREKRRLSMKGSAPESLGVTIEGTTVVGVTPGSAAEAAGLRRGVVLKEVEGKAISTQAEAAEALARVLSSNSSAEVVTEVPVEAGQIQTSAEFLKKYEEAQLQIQRMDIEHTTEIACLRAALAGASDAEVGEIRQTGTRRVEQLFADWGEAAPPPDSTTARGEEWGRLFQETRRMSSQKQTLHSFQEEAERFGRTIRRLEEENGTLREERRMVSQEYGSVRQSRSRVQAENEDLRESGRQLKGEAKALRDSRDAIREKHRNCAVVIAELEGRLRAAQEAAEGHTPEGTLAGMWEDIKSMHRKLDVMTVPLEVEETSPPRNVFEMNREVTCVRQRMRDAQSPSPPTPGAEARSRESTPRRARGTPRRSRSRGSGSSAPSRRVSVSPPPSWCDGSHFGKFGVSLSESLFTENGIIAYTGVRIVEAAPPGAPFLKANDVITQMGDIQVGSFSDFKRAAELTPPHRYLMFKVRRWEDGCIKCISVKVRSMATGRRPGSPGGLNKVLLDHSGESVQTWRQYGKKARPRAAAKQQEPTTQDPLKIFTGRSSSPTSPGRSQRSDGGSSRSGSPSVSPSTVKRRMPDNMDEFFEQTVAAGTPKTSSPSPAVAERRKGSPASHASTGQGRTSYHGLSDEAAIYSSSA